MACAEAEAEAKQQSIARTIIKVVVVFFTDCSAVEDKPAILARMPRYQPSHMAIRTSDRIPLRPVINTLTVFVKGKSPLWVIRVSL
jgi:hypothetical protein